MTHFRKTMTSLAAATATALFAVPAMAATTTDKANTLPAKVEAAAVPEKTAALAEGSYSDRERMTFWNNEKQRLMTTLKPGQTKAAYMQALAQDGYTITSINADKKDYLEYEVVKGANSYEVQIDLDKSGKGAKIAIESNIWRSDATKEALRGTKVPVATQYLPQNSAYSDRTRMTRWTSEKDKLEKALAVGKDMGFYTSELKKHGYQVTATNDRDKDYVEMEVVKGTDSYEVQIDLDASGKAKKVDVAANMWHADATEKALEKSGK